MELQEALEIISERLAFHDHKQGHAMPSDCAAENEDLLCCMDKTAWEATGFVSKEVPNPFRVALDVVMAEAIKPKQDEFYIERIELRPENYSEIIQKTAGYEHPTIITREELQQAYEEARAYGRTPSYVYIRRYPPKQEVFSTLVANCEHAWNGPTDDKGPTCRKCGAEITE